MLLQKPEDSSNKMNSESLLSSNHFKQVTITSVIPLTIKFSLKIIFLLQEQEDFYLQEFPFQNKAGII
jgi:hypothetical protein